MAKLAEHLISAEEREQDWFVFVENREAVIAALKEGRCDGILPAARSFLDGFAEFCLRAGVLKAFEAFPDRRARRSIPMFFFCNTLVHRPLWHLPRLQPIQDTLFRSPYILRQLGFNARQIDAGFYRTAEGAKPFTAGAIADAFVRAQPEDFLTNQQAVLRTLWDYCPGQFQSALWAMDSVHFGVPRGAHTPEQAFKACVLGVWQDSVVWPLLWMLVPSNEAEITVGRKLVAAAEAVIGAGSIRHLLVDRGYLDGAWLTELHARGTRVTIGVREDMLIMEDMRNLSRLPGQTWEAAEPPKIHTEPKPVREIMTLPAMEAEWEACEVPLSACLIRDTFPDKVRYRGLVTTEPDIPACDILKDDRKRWTLEEVFMTLTCYWHFDDLPPCRLGVAYAMSHFALLAFTLMGFYLQETDALIDIKTWNKAPPPLPLPERELAVYAGPYFALLLPSQLVTLILEHMDAWQANREQLLMALRLTEGNT
jgi:hypothetical protein